MGGNAVDTKFVLSEKIQFQEIMTHILDIFLKTRTRFHVNVYYTLNQGSLYNDFFICLKEFRGTFLAGRSE